MKKLFFILLMGSLILSFLAIGCISCSTFKPIESNRLADYPECVLAMNTFEAYKAINEKSGVVLPADACLKAIKRQKCIREVWNIKSEDGYYMPDWSDEIGKTRFDACMNRP